MMGLLVPIISGFIGPTSQIEFVGATCSPTNSATIPAHQADDLILAFAVRDGNNSMGFSGSDGFTLLDNTGGGAVNIASLIAYKIADSTSELTGSFGFTHVLAVAVYRGVNVADPIGGLGLAYGSVADINYPGVTMEEADGSSWVASFAGHTLTTTNLEDAPIGMVNRANGAAGAAENTVHDTDGGVTGWAGDTVTLSSAHLWTARSVEIKSA